MDLGLYLESDGSDDEAPIDTGLDRVRAFFLSGTLAQSPART